ncbi:lipase [Nocardia uniformis]|uniref:Lipase n=1 Tax=Nocardia uniformis TaxID=53432 RepID=A0A849BYZ3_9NOCA|nr:lipase family protein [Nocardia uniformis]NNH71732.1 lipase [Nocardia uniformis]
MLIAVAIALTAAVAPMARPQIPVPDADPFYAPPESLAQFGNGAILNSRPIAVFGLPLPVAGWQVQYRSTDSLGQAVAEVATVIVPPGQWSGGGDRPLLSYQIAEDSLGTRCAPSYALRGGRDFSIVHTLLDVPFLTESLRRGWAVVVSDYQGPQSRFFDGITSGRGVLDGIRAARDFPPLGITASSPIGAWGYSGGAFATLWAAQLRATYAPDLWLSGVSAGGVPANIPELARGVDGELQAGLAMLIVLALTRNDPGSGMMELLNDRGRAALAQEVDACGVDLVVRYLFTRMDDYSSVPNLLSHPVFEATAARQELGGAIPDVPLYLYHSTSDDVTPVAAFTALRDRYCAGGATVTSVHSGVPGHNPAALVESIGAMSYLSDRFAGIPAPQGCTTR